MFQSLKHFQRFVAIICFFLMIFDGPPVPHVDQITNDFSQKRRVNTKFFCFCVCFLYVLLGPVKSIDWLIQYYSLTRGLSPLLIIDLFDPVWRVGFFCFNLSWPELIWQWDTPDGTVWFSTWMKTGLEALMVVWLTTYWLVDPSNEVV